MEAILLFGAIVFGLLVLGLGVKQENAEREAWEEAYRQIMEKDK